MGAASVNSPQSPNESSSHVDSGGTKLLAGAAGVRDDTWLF